MFTAAYPAAQLQFSTNTVILAASGSFVVAGPLSSDVGLRVSSSAYLATDGGWVGIGLSTSFAIGKLHMVDHTCPVKVERSLEKL
jgi:hypothetical protein